MSNCATKNVHPRWVAYNHQKYCGDFSETTVFKSYGVKHKRKSQYANYYGLPAICFSCSMYTEAPEVTA